MADLRIVDTPEIPTENITGEEKLPTGGNGNYSISLDSLADYTKTKKDLVDTTTVDGKVNGVRQELDAHIEDLLNPHQVTKGQIGLGNVDNTADADKPVSNSTQSAIISAVTPKADKSYVDGQLALKSNKVDVYTKSETYTKQESSDLVNNSISTALTHVNSSLDLVKRGIANRYDSSLTYNSGERVVLTNGDIVKSTIDGNTNNPNSNMTWWVNTDYKVFQTISDLIAEPLPSENSVARVISYRSGWAAETIYRGSKGGGLFKYNASKSSINDGIHCFNGWERIDYDKHYVNTDIAGFYGDGTNDDYASFIRVNKYIITLDFWTPKTFEMMQGNFLVSSFTDECIIVPEYGLTTLCTVTGNMTIKGQGKDKTKITYSFDYLAWMYAKFTTAYELNAGLISNPLHCTFSPNKNYVSHIKGINIESFSVDLKGDVYYYNQEQATKSQEGKAFCSISPISWALNTIQDIKVTDLKTIRNPSMQNIAFNNSLAYTNNVIIHGTEHEYCGEASSLLNKCPDHSSIYCNGKYTKITGSKFVSSRASTINCAIEFHGSGEVSGNEFIDCAAPLYFVNLHGYQGGTFNEFFDNTEITIKNNKVRGAIYGIGYANGGNMTLNIENNNIKLRKEKSNSTWVSGKVYVHSGLDARGLINLNETANSYTKVVGGNNIFEQEEPTDWATEDNYINSCIATKNIQELDWIGNTFINFKGAVLVLEKPISGGTMPKIFLSKNTYVGCGSVQNASEPHLVTDSIVYVSNGDILDFTNAASNTTYGNIHIDDETYINCKYKRAIAQFKYDTLFAKVRMDINCQDAFLTPVSFVSSYSGTDSYTDYSFNMSFGRVTPNSEYGMGNYLKGHKFTIEYEYLIPSTERLYRNTCIKLDQVNSFSTTSQAINTLSIISGDKPNGISISDRDAVYFPLNRSNEVQKVNYNSSTRLWS